MKSLHADPSAADDELLIPALRRGDEAAFRELLDRHGGGMLRFAMLYTADPAIAEDAVQDTWMGVLTGIVRFEHRSSLKTWIYSILLNRVRSRTKREGRLIPFSALFDASACPDEPAVEPERFAPPDHPRAPGHWYSVHAPKSWGESPETRMLSKEVRTLVDEAIRTLPPAQAEVITLRDREGWSSSEVCSVLGIGESNQRVLLHRARSRVRRALERYLLEG